MTGPGDPFGGKLYAALVAGDEAAWAKQWRKVRWCRAAGDLAGAGDALEPITRTLVAMGAPGMI